MEQSTKNNYSVPRYQLATIYQGLKRLSYLVHRLMFFMTKDNKRIYGETLAKSVLDALHAFIIAFDFQEKRPDHYMELVGKIHEIMCDMDMIIANKALMQMGHKKDKDGKEIPNKEDKLIIQIYEEIGKIDMDTRKWKPVALVANPTNKIL